MSDDGEWLAVSDLYETKLFYLSISPAGELVPRRVKSFVHTLQEAEKLASLSLSTTGTGSTALLFTPDSQRLIMALTHLVVVVVSLPTEDDDARVLECFKPIESDGGRTIIRRQRRGRGKKGKNAQSVVNGDDDVEMAEDAAVEPESEAESDAEEDEEKDEEKDEDEGETAGADKSAAGAWRVCLAASDDGQWLSTSDTLGRVAIYNLDTLRVSRPMMKLSDKDS